MMRNYKLVLGSIAIIGVISGCKSSKQTAAVNAFANDGYKLVWADEFNKDGKPDTTIGDTKKVLFVTKKYNGTSKKMRL